MLCWLWAGGHDWQCWPDRCWSCCREAPGNHLQRRSDVTTFTSHVTSEFTDSIIQKFKVNSMLSVRYSLVSVWLLHFQRWLWWPLTYWAVDSSPLHTRHAPGPRVSGALRVTNTVWVSLAWSCVSRLSLREKSSPLVLRVSVLESRLNLHLLWVSCNMETWCQQVSAGRCLHY